MGINFNTQKQNLQAMTQAKPTEDGKIGNDVTGQIKGKHTGTRPDGVSFTKTEVACMDEKGVIHVVYQETIKSRNGFTETTSGIVKGVLDKPDTGKTADATAEVATIQAMQLNIQLPDVKRI